eukprot:SAG31_NODE_4761_length_2973_cov_2.001740_1_plen_363_part_00
MCIAVLCTGSTRINAMAKLGSGKDTDFAVLCVAVYGQSCQVEIVKTRETKAKSASEAVRKSAEDDIAPAATLYGKPEGMDYPAGIIKELFSPFDLEDKKTWNAFQVRSFGRDEVDNYYRYAEMTSTAKDTKSKTKPGSDAEEQVPKVRIFGMGVGECQCGDGTKYLVGDMLRTHGGTGCLSLACAGGKITKECKRQDSQSATGIGMMVTCKDKSDDDVVWKPEPPRSGAQQCAIATCDEGEFCPVVTPLANNRGFDMRCGKEEAEKNPQQCYYRSGDELNTLTADFKAWTDQGRDPYGLKYPKLKGWEGDKECDTDKDKVLEHEAGRKLFAVSRTTVASPTDSSILSISSTAAPVFESVSSR